MRFISHCDSRTAMLWMLLVAFILSACGGQSQEAPMFRANPARTGVFPSNGPTTMNELMWKFKTGNEIASSPAVAGGVVYVGSREGWLYAVDAKTGQEKWSFNTGSEVFSSPAVADGIVYVGMSEFGPSPLYALDVKTGQEKWSFQTNGLVNSSPAVADGVVYVGSNDGRLYALDATTGEEKWRFKTGGPVASSPAIAGGVVYFSSPVSYTHLTLPTIYSV